MILFRTSISGEVNRNTLHGNKSNWLLKSLENKTGLGKQDRKALGIQPLMCDWQKHLDSIVNTIADYHIQPKTEDIELWISQFEKDVQLPILREIDFVFKRTYFSEKRTKKCLKEIFSDGKLVGSDPCWFWKGVEFIRKQGGGNSQRVLLGLFDELLQKECDFETADYGTRPRRYVYIDDAVFTGTRVKDDLACWIKKEAPEEDCECVIVLVDALHIKARKVVDKNLLAEASKAGKKIDFKWVCHRKWKDEDVLLKPNSKQKTWSPVETNIFSSEKGRKLLEQEFYKASKTIRSKTPGCTHPMGFSPSDDKGFGSLLVTYRNCPNSTPLVLRNGDHPLFRRITNFDVVN